MNLDLENKGISIHWRNGDLVILYDKQIWNSCVDSENSQVIFYKHPIRATEVTDGLSKENES